jgi:PKD repeat protein
LVNALWRFVPDCSCPSISCSIPIHSSFTVTPLSGCKPLTVNFTNLSTNATSYLWHFGDGGTSILTNPSHLYGNSGNYTVTLIAYDSTACGVFTDTSSQTFYFTVFIPPTAPTITEHGDTLISSYNTNNQWYLDTTAIAGATDSIYIVHHTGCYHVDYTDTNGCVGKSDTVCFSFAGIYEINNNHGISIYPNPNDGTFTIYNLPFIIYNLKITDVLGREVYHQAIINQTKSTIQLNQLSSGVYFYQLTTNKETVRGKFVVEK